MGIWKEAASAARTPATCLVFFLDIAALVITTVAVMKIC